ncbi:LysR substrate-binding domain-containing protein [Microbacterium pseudoresistens]|uniref:DNA-binding transcriptional LysR family regulator n=1 Tax=Microbacterium pseudoresistens TaxID=640634 RepID=A0A7Y9ESV0_9MICO|nr:LysR family transcriptional regulator [Microbacterium pseudoresistens]NYD53216.1 DNA-binding transcriptional LysR family regulator [Microbacterium pseudoresistens]
MELRLLRYFVAVCEHGTVHGAADTVHVAQPSLSRQIRRLEQDLGFALFDRAPRGLTLTAAGRAFLPVAQDLLTRAARATSTARAIASGAGDSLTVASAATTVTDIIAPFVVRQGADGPIGNTVEVFPENVYGVFARGDADFAVGTRIPPAEFRSRVIGHAYLWAQVHPAHPLAGARSISLARLVNEPLIVMSRSHGVRHMFDTAVARAGLSYTPAVETDSSALAIALAAAGRGLSVLSDDSRYGLRTVPIRAADGDLAITLYGVWDDKHFARDRIVQCLDELGDFVAELYPQGSHSARSSVRPDTPDAS